MAAIPYMPFYVADYLADAAHLTTLEHGAYLLLIMNYWQRGKPLPDIDKKLSRIAGLAEDEWARIRPELEEFFDIEDGEWRHKRIDAELDAVRSKSEKAREAGKASAKQRLSKRSANVEQPLNERSTDVQPSDADTEQSKKNPPTPQGGEPADDEFGAFWAVYPKRVGKTPAQRAWNRLKISEREHAVRDVQARIRGDPQWLRDGGQFVPNPATYLNQRRFDDDWQAKANGSTGETHWI